ncbi:hypothetical protein BKA65DRAFT_544142 [Rhexocercosporidium sp. MPI-PUGE-AT-0058]|nr:hypothetical protein BKA65DRAFT_544142 [Rhexocercosporidium sp. MPI-PUGE-AT-0058]
MAKAAFAGRILLLPTLCFSKISVLIVVRHLFHYESRRKLLLIDATILGVAAWGFAATTALSANCSPQYLVEIGFCPNQIGRLRGLMITEILTEVVVFVLSPSFLYSFDIAPGTKMLVVSAFSFRLPLIPLSTLPPNQNQLHPLSQHRHLGSTRHSLRHPLPLLYQEILISYAPMSATIPCMKSFIEGFMTGGVGYVTDPQAGRVPTKTTGQSAESDESDESDESYELGKVKRQEQARSGEVEEGVEAANGTVNEVKQDGARRISARLSRAWNGPGHAEGGIGADRQGSETPMVR